MRRSVAGRALAALVLLAALALPSTASPQTRPAAGKKAPAVAVRTAEAGLFHRLWSLLTPIWGATGSGLDPDGRGTPTGTPANGTASPAGDTGSGLDPNGK